jgi:RAP1 GTPase activating protein 1
MTVIFFSLLVVNAERASYKAPSFAPKLQRTRTVLLHDVATKYMG